MQVKDAQQRLLIVKTVQKDLENAKSKIIKIQNYISQHLLALKGTSKLANLFSKAEEINNRLSLKGFNTVSDLIMNTGNYSNVTVEHGADLKFNELGKYNDAQTPKEKQRIKQLRKIISKHPHALYTYINTWKMGRRGPIQRKFDVQYTSAITIANYLSKVISNYDKMLVTLHKK